MIVLVDTSVWVEYFRRRPRLASRALDRLDELLVQDFVATVHPIRAEILSGRLEKEREPDIRSAFAALRSVDLDWKAVETWDEIARCATQARAAGIPATSIVDRMVLLAAERAAATLWTVDDRLTRLATSRGCALLDA